jgi:anti-sigma factor ChrR (cupin superfamily)
MTDMPIDRQAEGSLRLDPGSAEWQETDAAGFAVKPLFADARSGESTQLMRIAPGAWFPAHAHTQLEEIFVLEGDFYDDAQSYGPGQYCQRAIGAQHTAGSHGGCTVLLIYRN